MKLTRVFLPTVICGLVVVFITLSARSVETQSTAAKPAAKPAEAAKASVTMKPCSRCSGTGKAPCGARDCKDGFNECPGECLKVSKGVWEHMKVEGHGDEELWQKFYTADRKHWAAFTQAHCGEIVVIEADKVTSGGPCPKCGGSTKVNCSICEATKEMVCPACNGKKVLPENWVAPATAKPKLTAKPIRLKNGQTIMGKIEMQFGSKVYIRTEDGKRVEKDASEIIAETAK